MTTNSSVDGQLSEWAFKYVGTPRQDIEVVTDLFSELEVKDVPEKLRCAVCGKLAINAVKLPCCDSTICNHCHNSLQTETDCPICMHNPFSAPTAVAAKTLQTTIKAFIRTQAKKAGIDPITAKPIVQKTPSEPPVPTPAPAEEPLPDAPLESTPPDAATRADHTAVTVDQSNAAPELQEAELTRVNGEALELEKLSSVHLQDNAEEDDDNEEEEDSDDEVTFTLERPQEDYQDAGQQESRTNGDDPDTQQQDMRQDQHQEQNTQPYPQQPPGFDHNMGGFNNGGFPDMSMGAFNPMMGMQGFGMMPHMMGMGMDPSMMFNGNFGGMGDMSMMGMGMGMNGMDGMGNFGGMNPGFFPNQGSYMQSNFGNTPRQNFYNDRGYGRPYGRGYGRGRGNYGRGRGGWNQQYQHQPHQQQQYGNYQQTPPAGPQQSGGDNEANATRSRGSPSYEPLVQDGGAALDAREEPDTAGIRQRAGDAIRSADATHVEGEATAAVTTTESGDPGSLDSPAAGDRHISAEDTDRETQAMDLEGGVDDPTTMRDETNNDTQHGQQSGMIPRGPSNVNLRGGFRGRGGFSARAPDMTELTPGTAPPVNAPTGPKAMRQGLPNTGRSGRLVMNTQTKPSAMSPSAPPPEPSKPQIRDSVSVDRDHRARTCSKSRSPSRHRSNKHRETTAHDDDGASDDGYARRNERDRRRRKDRARRYETDESSRDHDGSTKKYRSRSFSRDDDDSRRRHRERDDEHRSSRSRRDRSKDRRRRRHRSKSGERESDDDHSRRKSKSHREYDGDDHDRHRDSHRSHKPTRRDDEEDDGRDDDKRHRSSRSSKHARSSRDDDRDRDRDKPRRSSLETPSDEIGFKIKGSKSARSAPREGNSNNMAAPPPPPAGPAAQHRGRDRDRRSGATEPSASSADPYAEERARAQQGREAREAQRRQSTTHSALGKRGRDDDELDAPRGPKGDRGHAKKGRRMNVKYEDEIRGDDRDRGRRR